jgi:methylthioribose-1-phosphate isomerase
VSDETQVDDPIEEIENEWREQSEKAVQILDDMRPVAVNVGKAIARSGVPEEFQRRATALIADIEALEQDLSTYVVGVER